MASSMRAFVSAGSSSEPLSSRDTVATETPAVRATSFRLVARFGAIILPVPVPVGLWPLDRLVKRFTKPVYKEIQNLPPVKIIW